MTENPQADSVEKAPSVSLCKSAEELAIELRRGKRDAGRIPDHIAGEPVTEAPDEAVAFAKASPFPEAGELWEHLYP